MPIVLGRISSAGCVAESCFDAASEVIVFGSMAAGLDRPGSDVDVMFIGGPEMKVKTELLDLVVFPRYAIKSPAWLQSELAAHVGYYGVWIKGAPNWTDRAQVGERAIGMKRRRVEAFMQHLPDSWSRLNEGFRVKYSIKVRREAQRLLLLSRRLPIPPTRTLDTSWDDLSLSQGELPELLQGLARPDSREFSRQFLTYVEANLHRSHA